MTRISLITDAFTWANGTALPDYLPPWYVAVAGGLEIQGNGFQAIAAGENGNGYDITIVGTKPVRYWGPDHYAKCTVVSVASSYSPGVLARATAGGNDYCVDPPNTSTLEIARHDSGAWTQLATGSISLSVTDTISIEAEQDEIRAFHNGSLVVSTTDATHASGDPGVYCYQSPGIAVGDDFDAGRISSRIDPLKVFMAGRLSPTRIRPQGLRVNIARRR